MRLGLIARGDNTGLGTQTWELHRHLCPARTMLLDLSPNKRNILHPDRYPDVWATVPGFPSKAHFIAFLDGLDVVYTAETPYGHVLFDLAEKAGVRTVLHYNYEFLDHLNMPQLPKPTVFASPSAWHYGDLPYANKCRLPVPIALDRFADYPPSASTATRFLHIAGKPAIHDRNGTADLLQALQHVRSPITVIIKCQDPQYVSKLMANRTLPEHVELVTDTSDTLNYWDNYRQGDVLVLPRRYGGLCLPVNEALGAGLPVIMPNIAPNNTWLPQGWLVPAIRQGQFTVRTTIDLYTVDHVALAAKIDQFATDRGFFAASQEAARVVAKQLSWDNLRPEYERLFNEL